MISGQYDQIKYTRKHKFVYHKCKVSQRLESIEKMFYKLSTSNKSANLNIDKVCLSGNVKQNALNTSAP